MQKTADLFTITKKNVKTNSQDRKQFLATGSSLHMNNVSP